MRFFLATAITVGALLSGCAANVKRDAPTTAAAPGVAPTATAVASPSAAAAKSVILEVSGSGAVAASGDWNAFLQEWQTSMSAAVAAKGASFTLVKSPATLPAGPAVLVRLKVNDFKYVSQAKRYGIGVFSGNAFMDVDAEYVELPQRKTLGTRKFQTSSSAWQGVFSAMTPKQVEAVSKEIVGETLGK